MSEPAEQQQLMPKGDKMYISKGINWKMAVVLTIFVFLTAIWMIASSGVVLTDTSSDSTPYKFSIFTMIWGVILFIIGAVGAGIIANDKFEVKVTQRTQ
jgi:hypothetical protein